MTPATDPILAALRARRSPIRSIRYRANRSVLLSVSRDGRTLNSHVCFRHAPPEIAEAAARFLTARRGSSAARHALDTLRSWEGTRRGLEAARRERPPSRPTTDGPDAAPLRALFDRLNRERFDGRIPAVPLRVSHRMTRSLGTIRYGPDGGGAAAGGAGAPSREPGCWEAPAAAATPRSVIEIAISADLLIPRNRDSLEDTMLHEMAHAEAWLRHGHRGHGAPWRRIARRVGCTPRATCRTPIARPPSTLVAEGGVPPAVDSGYNSTFIETARTAGGVMQRRKQWMVWAGGGAVAVVAAATIAAAPVVPAAGGSVAADPVEAPAAAASPAPAEVNGVEARPSGAAEATGTADATPVLETQVGSASYYANMLAGRPTASGVPYDPSAAVAAHRRLPFGTRLRVHNLANGRMVEVEVVDRGPFAKGRILDLSRSAAEKLDFIRAGHTRVRIEVLEYGG